MSRISDTPKCMDYIAPSLYIHQFSFDGILCNSVLKDSIEDVIVEDGTGSWSE